MNCYEFDRLVPHYFECSMRRITTSNASGARRDRHLLAVGSFDHPAFNAVEGLFTRNGYVVTPRRYQLRPCTRRADLSTEKDLKQIISAKMRPTQKRGGLPVRRRCLP